MSEHMSTSTPVPQGGLALSAGARCVVLGLDASGKSSLFEQVTAGWGGGAALLVRLDGAGNEQVLQAVVEALAVGLDETEHGAALVQLRAYQGLLALDEGRIDRAQTCFSEAERLSEGAQVQKERLVTRACVGMVLAADDDEDEPPLSSRLVSTIAQTAQATRTLHVDVPRRTFDVGLGPVSLRRRRAPWLVFSHLVEAAQRRPGCPVSVAELIEAGWPGERILPSAASGRVYFVVRQLRKLGAEDVLVTIGGGYLIHEGWAIVVG